ncbi:E3 ubiquitin-protein ligase ubr3-like [Lineus longissimus]|uniref:E3 ubiquitin-protein ligase ubr3-like n=1 Tax=Lineus longissimus TaxID=88925 RepID=UPI002B4DD410
MAAQALMKRGKRPLASYLKAECCRPSGVQQLLDLLDFLLDKSKPIDDIERLDWLRAIIAGGATFDEFSRTVHSYDNATTCGLVWTANFVAYRCRTCGISPCMSLCSDCFQASDHRGHDYNMFRSQAGGACDCGDISVMNPAGFCSRHGPDRAQQRASTPPDLLVVAEIMMPKLIWRFVQYLRDNSKPEVLDAYLIAIQDADQFLTFLHSMSDMGAAMRHVMTKVMTDPHIYKNYTTVPPVQTSRFSSSHSNTAEELYESQESYKAALETLECPPMPDDLQGLCQDQTNLVHTTFIEELMFWTLKFEFPQKVVTLLLSILPDDDYKEAFTKAFVQHYSRISMALVKSIAISNRVVHISVQLFSNEMLATKMVENNQLMGIMIASLDYMMKGVLTESVMQDPEQNYHNVVDCSRNTLREHCYWPVVSDLINVLSHSSIAMQMYKEQKHLQVWMELISYFQGMNLNQRELVQHVEFEPDTYYAAFSAELEICASPMWSLLVHLKEKSHIQYCLSMLKTILAVLHDWFESISARPSMIPNPLQVSFHLPLHRYFSLFTSQAMRVLEIPLDTILPNTDMLKLLMTHPLQIQVSFFEIFCGMWVRNGLQIKGQAMTYIQCHFCNSMVDADLFLLQICASRLDPEYYLRTLLERFHVMEWLSMNKKSRLSIDHEYELPMLEGALTFLTTLLSFRSHMGAEEKELTLLEMVSLLCVNDRTHSQLMDLMPEKCGLAGQTKDFEPILKEIADYKAPNFEAGGGMQQGMYVPKGHVWENDFNPIYTLLRAVHRRDFQSAMDRYTTYVRQCGKYDGKTDPWPPFRIPAKPHPELASMNRLLHSKTLHGVIFTILYKAVNGSVVPESVLYFLVFLLEMAVSTPPVHVSGKDSLVPSQVRDRHYAEWFPNDNIFTNLRHTIKNIVIKEMTFAPTDSSTSTSDVAGGFQPGSSTVAFLSPGPSHAGGFMPSVGQATGGATQAQTMAMTQAIQGNLSPQAQQLLQALANYQTPGEHSEQQVFTGLVPKELPRYESRGVSTDQDRIFRTEVLSINESILSLLMKLHSKLSEKPNSYVPESCRAGTSRQVDSTPRIGNGVFYIEQLLDQIGGTSSECGKQILELHHHMLPKEEKAEASPSKGSSVDKEERRRRARERQQKLMAEFASRQKAFMEQAMDTEDGGREAEHSSQAEQEGMAAMERSYDCVICGQASPSTEERPIGLVALAQSTSVLGHRRQVAEAQVVPVTPKVPSYHGATCRGVADNRFKTLKMYFDETSCLSSMNMGWEGGVCVQTCGHHLHLDCHKSYMQSLASDEHLLQMNQTLAVNKGEYLCPFCRQLANTLLPIVPDKVGSLSRLTPRDPCGLALEIGRLIEKRPGAPGTTNLTTAMGKAMEDLTNTAYPRFSSYSKHPCPESMELFYCSVARTNLELNLLQRSGHLCSPRPQSTKKRSSLVPLLNVLGLHSKILNPKINTDIWSRITGVTMSEEESSCLQPYLREVPVFLKDPAALLLQILLNLPSVIDRVYFQCLVRVLYNLQYIQALAVMSSKFTEEERDAWRRKQKQVTPKSLEGLLSVVIEHFVQSRLYEDVELEHNTPAICQSVWSPQSVESSVQEYCLPFLRISGVLQEHLYGEEIPQDENAQKEYQLLCRFLHLCHLTETEVDPMQFQSALAVNWHCEDPWALIRTWGQDFVSFVNQQSLVAKNLLLVNPTWHTPHLFKLPKEYDIIFQHYRKKQCSTCMSVPKDPAICLVCSQFVCFKESCCRQREVYECVQHSICCGAGTGLFLIVNSSVIVVVRGARATLWGSVYLDEYGEEDRDLKRGKPLYLSEDRYRLLEQQWINHTFDHVCKKWIWHHDRL